VRLELSDGKNILKKFLSQQTGFPNQQTLLYFYSFDFVKWKNAKK